MKNRERKGRSGGLLKLKKPVIRRILSYMKPHAGYLVLALIFAIIEIAGVLLAPVVAGQAIDYIVGAGNVNFSVIFTKIIQLLVIIAVVLLFQWLMGLCTNRVSFLTIRDMRDAAFRKLNAVPLKYIDSHSHGDIMSRVTVDIDQISDGLIQGFTQLFTGVVTIVGTIVFMLSINWMVTLVVVLVTPLSIFVAYFIARGCHKMFTEQALRRGEMSGLVEEMLGSQKLVKAYGREAYTEEKFDVINRQLKVCGTKAMFYSAMTNPSTRFVNGLVYAGVAIFGAILCVNGRLTVGQLSMFLNYANQYTKPFNEVTGVITELQTAMTSARRVFDILDEAEESSDAGKAVVTGFDGNVDIEHVAFSYSDTPLIEDFDLSVKSGQRVAIVGPTGCGKTTLINLLMRFYDAQKGEIRVDGMPVQDMTRSSLRGGYGMVLQDTWLFHGTVKENIAYGKPDATDEEIVAAAKSAHIHSYIMRLDKGYDTVIEDDGNISQGQKQLLCIARIMLTKPPMLILDEATSNIDTRTEIRIQKAFAKMMEGRTSFIVAHRLSTIKEADIILVMNSGNIVEKGTHDELLAKGGFYSELYQSQFARGEDAPEPARA